VGNEDDGRAVLDQCAQGLEQVLHFARGEHCGGLIQNENGGLSIQGFEDLDTLAQPDGKILDQGMWINVEMILYSELAYMLSRRWHVQEWSAPGWFLAKDNILGYGEGRDEHEMLMDHANAAGHGVSGAGEMHRGATHDNVSLVWPGEAIKDVHQRGLPRTVFP